MLSKELPLTLLVGQIHWELNPSVFVCLRMYDYFFLLHFWRIFSSNYGEIYIQIYRLTFFFSFIILKMPLYFLPSLISDEKSAVIISLFLCRRCVFALSVYPFLFAFVFQQFKYDMHRSVCLFLYLCCLVFSELL